MEVYRRKHSVGAEGLSTQALFKLLQDIAGEQCIPLKLSGPDLEKRGLMWVIIKYRVQVSRWPRPGETILAETWPGKTRHGMMPRFYVLRDEAGETLLAASSVWAVVDRQSRAMVNNEELGVHIDPVETGEEIRLPGAVKKLETTQEKRFRVPAEYLDENGHMNNTFYYSVAEDCLGRDARRDRLLEIGTEHVSEALCGEELLLRWTESEGLGYVTGSFGDKPIFRMNLKYA